MEFEKVREIIAEQMNMDIDAITLETNFIEDLGADSLDIYQVITELEDAFDVKFTNDIAESIKTVGDAVEFIKNQK
jgi:acyl carrier protein